MTTTKPKRLLRLGLGLLDWGDEREKETAWVHALPGAIEHFDEVLIALPSLYEDPYACDHELVRRVVDVCRGHGVPFDLGFRLWVTWAWRAARKQQPGDWCDPAYYTAALMHTHAEARRIGATGTHICCEPHGNAFHTKWFRDNGFTPEQRDKVEAAVQHAVDLAGPVDYAYPAGGGYEKSFSWPMRALGKENLHSKTYYAHSPDGVSLRPPPGYTKDLHYWGVLLVGDGAPPGSGLTVQQYLNLDWPAIKTAFPECEGTWCMPHPDYRLEILETFRRIA